MIERCDACKHDRRRHHRMGGCCEKIPPYVEEIETCPCDAFRSGVHDG